MIVLLVLCFGVGDIFGGCIVVFLLVSSLFCGSLKGLFVGLKPRSTALTLSPFAVHISILHQTKISALCGT